MKKLKRYPFMGPMTFFCGFLKMHQPISTLLVILSFMKIFVAQTSRTRFSSLIVEKLNTADFI